MCMCLKKYLIDQILTEIYASFLHHIFTFIEIEIEFRSFCDFLDNLAQCFYLILLK